MKLLLLVLVGVAVEVRSQEGGCTDDAEADASVTKQPEHQKMKKAAAPTSARATAAPPRPPECSPEEEDALFKEAVTCLKKEQNRCRCFNEGAGFQQCLGLCNESVRASLCPKATPAGGDCGEDEVVALIQHCIESNSALNACIQSKEKTLCGCFSRNQEAHKCVSACGVEARGAICPGVVHKKTPGGAPRAAAGDAAAVDDKAEEGAAGEHLKSAFDLLDEMPLPGEDEQQQQQQTPPPPPPPPFRPQQHQTQNQPACDEAAGIARIRSCVGTVVALRSCLEDQSKDACFCIQQSEGSKACLGECFPVVETSLCGSASNSAQRPQHGHDGGSTSAGASGGACTEDEAAATATRCFGQNATMLGCLRNDDGGGSPCSCFHDYPARCLGHCYRAVEHAVCEPAACTEVNAAASAKRCFGQNATMLECLRSSTGTPCSCFRDYPATCLGNCYDAVGKSLRLAGIQYYAAKRTLPPKNFQQAVIFIGMHQHPDHMEYLANSY
eukprot:gene12179-29262_t